MTPIPLHTLLADSLFLESELDRHPCISSRTVVVGTCAGELVYRCLDETDKTVLLADTMRQDIAKSFHLLFHADGTRR
ncbi:MAG: hypothetical protein ABF820_09675 [Sporolactobacillus sp.]